MKLTIKNEQGVDERVYFRHCGSMDHNGRIHNARTDCYTESGAVGTALCNNKDQFNKAKGRKLAFSRLLEDLLLNREQSRDAWKRYSQVFPKDSSVELIGKSSKQATGVK